MDQERQATSVRSGHEALERGAWDEAARWFTRAVEEGAGARAYEGLAWAAWWANDDAALFRAREHAFHLYREEGDRVSAARAAIWLACDHHDFRGEHAVANGWYQRARRLLDGVPTAPEHGWLAFHEGAYGLELADDTAGARRMAAEAAAVGRAVGLSELEFLSLALEGLALVTEGRVDDGMRCLDEASTAATSGELRDRIATAWTLCYLIYACERVRDFDRAAQWCRRMAEVSAQFSFELGIGVCRAHYGSILVLHGEWDRAERELVEAAGTLARTRPPAVAESDARLGELRRRQGRTAEAAELFARSEPHPLAVLGLASLALDDGRPAEAAVVVEDLLDATPDAGLTQRADALELLARARAAMGHLDAAAAAASRLASIAAAVGTKPLAAMAASATGAVALAGGDAAAARRRLEEAVELYQRSGLPYEAACARVDLSAALRRLGRHDAAARQAALAAERLVELGAPAAARRAAAPPAAPVDGLSAREVEVLEVLATGLTDREIAERLSISPHTVHRHVSNILAKLGLPSRSAAAAYAARRGLAR